MKLFRRCARISILCLLLVSVFIPIFILSHRLKQINADDEEGFVEDLSVLKHRAEAQELNAIEEDETEDVKEPNQVVYKDESKRSTGVANDEGNLNVQEQNESNQENEEMGHFNKDEMSATGVKKEQSTPLSLHRDVQPQSRRSAVEKVTEMKDQVIRARAYLTFAPPSSHMVKELKLRIKELERAMGDVSKDSHLPKKAFLKMKAMETTLSKASRLYPDCSAMVKKLRAMTHNAEDQIRGQKPQNTFLMQLAGRTIPRGMHCLSMRLTMEYFYLQSDEGELRLPKQYRSDDPNLFHFAVFSDNILACGVVVNSTVSAAVEPEKLVFHVVTDSVNYPAMSMWFLLNPPGKATIEVQSIDDFHLSSKYDNVILQKEDSFDSRYTSELNHLRFYLPELFPKLDKIVLLDHDVVVQRDLTGLWGVEMNNKVNGAVETCHEGDPSFRRMDTYINFSDPSAAKRIDMNSCTWAFGLNVFDLHAWRERDLTKVYHMYLRMGEEKPVFKAGSLPIGWMTFYNQTVFLERTWHILGLGSNSDVPATDIEQGAVIHFDGLMKPWLDIGLAKYKHFWWRHILHDHPFLQECNING